MKTKKIFFGRMLLVCVAFSFFSVSLSAAEPKKEGTKKDEKKETKTQPLPDKYKELDQIERLVILRDPNIPR